MFDPIFVDKRGRPVNPPDLDLDRTAKQVPTVIRAGNAVFVNTNTMENGRPIFQEQDPQPVPGQPRHSRRR